MKRKIATAWAQFQRKKSIHVYACATLSNTLLKVVNRFQPFVNQPVVLPSTERLEYVDKTAWAQFDAKDSPSNVYEACTPGVTLC
jgi:hypothetical protein